MVFLHSSAKVPGNVVVVVVVVVIGVVVTLTRRVAF